MATLATYAYTGRDAAGKIVKGKIDAPGESSVATRLRTMGVSPVSIAESTAGTGLSRDIKIPGMGSGVKLKDIAIMSRQMSTMIGAGLSLLKTLNILAEQTESKALAEIMSKVRDDVETGVSLSDAMSKFSKDFPPIMINMVRAGETGGFLDSALESVATNFEKELKLRGTIVSAMTYPVVVLAISLVAVLVMLIFIVPIFAQMFKSLGSQLPLPTQLLVDLSHIMVWVAPILIVGLIIFSFWWRTNKNTEKVRRRVDPVKLKLPVFGMLLKKIAIARFCRNFGNMIGAGVPILQALKIIGETSGNWVIEHALVKVADGVRQGSSISEPLMEQSVFPPMVTQMISVGEDSGSLETMLNKIAQFYDAEVEAMTDALTSLIEPLLIAFLGVVVGGMIIALYLPIFEITTAVGNSQ